MCAENRAEKYAYGGLRKEAGTRGNKRGAQTSLTAVPFGRGTGTCVLGRVLGGLLGGLLGNVYWGPVWENSPENSAGTAATATTTRGRGCSRWSSRWGGC